MTTDPKNLGNRRYYGIIVVAGVLVAVVVCVQLAAAYANWIKSDDAFVLSYEGGSSIDYLLGSCKVFSALLVGITVACVMKRKLQYGLILLLLAIYLYTTADWLEASLEKTHATAMKFEQSYKMRELPKEVNEELRITSPSNGDEVVRRTLIEGTVADPKVKVWVITHPMSTFDYWVQPAVTVQTKARTWHVMGYVGTTLPADIGEKFAIMAVANLTRQLQLREGERLDEWPMAAWRSDVIIVTRK